MVAPSIGPYRILEKLGAGGMGEVYLAEDSRLGRKVAIKTLLPSRLAHADARQRLLNEARTAATINHPNIAAIYDVLQTEDRMHIVMEYAHGETLSARVHRGPVRPAAVLDIALQLTDALAAAHEAGIVHRDLKSDNVLVHPNGRVKILDFGLARIHSPGPTSAIAPEDSTPEGRRSISGTPPYMSPEQILGGRVDQRSDIYSLGVVLFELLTGRRPFSGKDGVPLAEEILSRRTPSAREMNPYVPEELSAIVARAMAREPAARYQSAQEMRAELSRLSALLSDRPTLSHPLEWTPSPRAPTQPGRRPSLLAGTLALAAALAALLALRPPAAGRSGGGGGGSGGVPVLAVLPFVNVSNDRSDDPLGSGIADVLVSKLSRLPGVALLPLSATRPYRSGKRDPRHVAADLGASYVVEGGLQQSGDRLRVTAMVIDGGSGHVAWSDEFDAPTADVFALQHQLADGVAGALRLRLTPADRQRLGQPPTSDVEAFADYSQARSFLERPDIPGNAERAVELFQAAIAKDPRFALAHAGLGEAYWARWEQTKDEAWTVRARDETAEALRLDPEQAAVHVSLAVIYKGTGRAREAAEELQRALELHPDDDGAHRLLGQLRAEQGRRDEAVAHFTAAIAVRPNYWENHMWLGRAYYEQGRYAEAIKAFRRVTELQPDNPRGYQALGTALHASGNSAEAVVNYQRAIAIHPDSRAYSNLATAFYRQRRFADAVAAYDQAVKLEPGNPLLHRNLADAYRRAGDRAHATESLRRAAALAHAALQVNPRDSVTMSFLAVVEAKLGLPREAERHAREAASVNPSSALVVYRQAVVGALTGNAAESLEALGRALRLGYSPSEARQDEDLASLRDRSDFRSMLAAGA